MSNSDIRKAHKILDDLIKGNMVLDEEREFLRRALPELPKQKTLEEIVIHVNSALFHTGGSTWPTASYGDLEGWLYDLVEQLKGLETSAPALPAGMRLADHETYGRVVTSPKPDQDGVYVLLVPRPKVETGADWEYAHECELAFLDAEPAKPARPEFLETEADYENAPEGTIVAKDDISTAWIKRCGAWKSTDGDRGVRCPNWKVGHRIILRWGWKK